MDKRKDYYLILGVARDASTATIKRAYRRLAETCDSDSGTPTDRLREVQAAYETLTDADRRRRYDETLGEREPNRFEPLAWSFVRSPAVGDLRRPIWPGTLSGEILLTPGEAQKGGVLPLEVPLPRTCPACEGTGGPYFDCGACAGEGKLERRFSLPVRIPAGVRSGTVFQVGLDDPSVLSLLLVVHIRSV